MNILSLKEFEQDNIAHGFFGRKGGVSTGLYASLNCGRGSADDPDAIAQNREIVRKAMGGTDLLSLYQIHSPKCITIASANDAPIGTQADAMATDKPGIVLGVLTADCGPVLFKGEGPKGPVIGAAHSGWGGAVKGVLESTIWEMVKLGAKPETIQAAIGPCIRQQSYEVTQGFEDPFIKDAAESARFFQPAGPGKSKFDLAGYISFRLNRAGITRIVDCAVDTYGDESDYFSYRRMTHRAEPGYGRQISAIMIRS